MDDENLISPNVVDEMESQQENVLRPKTLNELHWTDKSKRKYESLYRSGKKRGEPLDHVLLYDHLDLVKPHLQT